MLQKVASNLENYGFGTKDIAPIGKEPTEKLLKSFNK
jgi:hypothetical protein